jgi:hypothetical protein
MGTALVRKHGSDRGQARGKLNALNQCKVCDKATLRPNG